MVMMQKVMMRMRMIVDGERADKARVEAEKLTLVTRNGTSHCIHVA